MLTCFYFTIVVLFEQHSCATQRQHASIKKTKRANKNTRTWLHQRTHCMLCWLSFVAAMRVQQQTLAVGHGGDGGDEAEAVERVAIAVHLAAERIELRSPRVNDALDTIDRVPEVAAELRVTLGAIVAAMHSAAHATRLAALRLVVRRAQRIVRRTLLAARARKHRCDTTLYVARAQTRRRDDIHAAQFDADNVDARVVARRRCRHRTRRLVGDVARVIRRCAFLYALIVDRTSERNRRHKKGKNTRTLARCCCFDDG